jgi:hypothetical protein
VTLLNVSPSGTFRRADWASVADASSTRAVVWGGAVDRRRRLRMRVENIERWKYRRVGVSRSSCGVHNRLQDEVPDDVVCETMARVQTRPALLNLLGCVPQPYATLRSSPDPIASVLPCCC